MHRFNVRPTEKCGRLHAAAIRAFALRNCYVTYACWLAAPDTKIEVIFLSRYVYWRLVFCNHSLHRDSFWFSWRCGLFSRTEDFTTQSTCHASHKEIAGTFANLRLQRCFMKCANNAVQLPWLILKYWYQYCLKVGVYWQLNWVVSFRSLYFRSS